MYDTGWTYVWQSVCCWSFIIWNVHVSVWKFIERIYKYTYCAYITYVFSQRIHFYTHIYTHPQDTMQVPTPWKVQLPGCPTALELGVKASSPGAGRLAGFPAKLPKKKETCQALQNTIKENIQVGPHFFWVFYLKKNKKVLWSLVACIKHCEMMSRRLLCWNCTNAFPFPRWGNPNYAPMIPAKNQKVHCYNHSVASGLREQDANWLNHLANSMQISVIPCGVKQQSRAIQRPSHVATTSLGNPFEKVKGSLRSNKAPAKCRIPDRQEG